MSVEAKQFWPDGWSEDEMAHLIGKSVAECRSLYGEVQWPIPDPRPRQFRDISKAISSLSDLKSLLKLGGPIQIVLQPDDWRLVAEGVPMDIQMLYPEPMEFMLHGVLVVNANSKRLEREHDEEMIGGFQ